jgi:polyphosphate kinase
VFHLQKIAEAVPAETDKKGPYYNRELSWLDFNLRVLEEAQRKDNPLIERLKFLSITSSNLDEFFMVRVAGVKNLVLSGYNKTDESGFTPTQLLDSLQSKIHTFTDKQNACYHRSIVPALEKENIFFINPEEADDKQKKFLENYFNNVMFPVLTPLAVDNSRPFPLLYNRSLNIAVRLEKKIREGKNDKCFAIIQVPSILPRFIEIGSDSQKRVFVLLENIIIWKLSELFELHKIKAAVPFRITRNSDFEVDEEADDFMNEMVKSIKKRKRGRPVRLEILQKSDKDTKKFLIENLKVQSSEIYESNGPIDFTFFMKFAFLPGFTKYSFKPIVPVNPPADFYGEDDIFAAIRKKDRLVHHPYESFDSVVNFIETAANDENVLAIKQTLYRVSGNSPIITALIKAAENGKQVTVLVELKARFDEENNINWARMLEKSGCHVIYGLAGLKTHCKIALVVRREEDGIRRYLHLGTGNYNDSTAKIYTDIGLFTCSDQFGADASSLFNVITGYSRPPEYNHFIVAPYGMRSFFERMIKNEIENANRGLPSGITVKVNSLVDPEIINLLYTASQAGVKIELIVRGICCLTPGIPGISDNIHVISIVGQLLEHSRIFLFCNDNSPKIYCGSADWMPRNLDRRIELIFPIEDPSLKDRVISILDTMLSDNTNARVMSQDNSYHLKDKRGKEIISCQATFAKDAIERLNAKKKNITDSPVVHPFTADDNQ